MENRPFGRIPVETPGCCSQLARFASPDPRLPCAASATLKCCGRNWTNHTRTHCSLNDAPTEAVCPCRRQPTDKPAFVHAFPADRSARQSHCTGLSRLSCVRHACTACRRRPPLILQGHFDHVAREKITGNCAGSPRRPSGPRRRAGSSPPHRGLAARPGARCRWLSAAPHPSRYDRPR